MEMNQVAEIVTDVTAQYVGEEAVSNVDTDKIVDMGAEILDTDKVDHYMRDLIDHIGKVVFVNRPYSGGTPSVMMDSWEFGAVEQKITFEGLPEAEDNDTWNLQDRHSYDPNIFYKPSVSAKFFSKRTTFEIPMSFAQRQVKSAFNSAGQVQALFSMIETAISDSLTVKTDALIESTINNFIVSTYLQGTGSPRICPLLTEFTAFTGKTAPSATTAFSDTDFNKFFAFAISRRAMQMRKLSTLFNTGGKPRHTSADRLHLILHSDALMASEMYLQSDTFHNDFVKLPNAESVAFWQGSGEDFAFADTSKIIITPEGAENPVTLNNVVGVMFDREALGVSNLDRRVTTNWNPKGEFTNNWYKADAGYFNDLNENGIVFILA